MSTAPSEIPVPVSTPAIRTAERRGDLMQWAILALVAVVLVGTVIVVIVAVQGQAKQTTTERAAKSAAIAVTRQLVISQRADCRSEYNSARQAVIEDANSVGRTVQASILGYFLSLNTTTEIQDSKAALDAANVRVSSLKSLPDMVDHGWVGTDGVKHPACPVVK